MNRGAVYVVTGFEDAPMGMQAFVSRQQRWVNIEQSTLQCVNECDIENAHVACEEHKIGLEPRRSREQARVVSAATLAGCDRKRFSMQSSSSGSFESQRCGTIGEDADDLSWEVASATGVVEGEQVAARARDHHHEPRGRGHHSMTTSP